VSYLGLNTMRSLVLSYAVFREFGAGDAGLLEKEQEHSLLCSRIARQLLPDRRAADTASTAALLHDVGTLALVSHLRDDHRANVERARAEGVGIHRIEAERLGVTHAEVGAYLLGLWGLPHDIIEATLRHHAGWDEVGALDVVAAVQIADAMATRNVYSADDARFHCDPPPPEVIQTLGLAPTLAKIETELLAGLGNGSSL
jgi:HD-like signal output (HDOD) protein